MKTKFNKLRRFLIATLLILVVATTTTACSSSTATLPNSTMDRISAYTRTLAKVFYDLIKGLLFD